MCDVDGRNKPAGGGCVGELVQDERFPMEIEAKQ
jgi:hypothetical protein